MAGPNAMTVRMYHVGFGDCFLLTFHYRTVDRHLLIDFGSTRGSKAFMAKIAADICEQTNGKLDAVVATHRHQDHLLGFSAPQGEERDASSGGLIASLKPELVTMTWTEDPRLEADAQEPVRDRPDLSFVSSLRSMAALADRAKSISAKTRGVRRTQTLTELDSLSDINIPNKSALQNLLTMAGTDGVEFLHYRKRTRLNALFRGVKFHVLGPPTPEQSSSVLRQRSRDEDEYWHLANYWSLVEGALAEASGGKKHPFSKRYRAAKVPGYARWLIGRMRNPAARDLLEISRVMDRAINNTSVILLIEAGDQRLLFPGDAQIESWEYALNGPHAEANRELLAGVTHYKVGHHGSLNGTPKTLWNLFRVRRDRDDEGQLSSWLSSRIDIHGYRSRDTEVPRSTLVEALRSGSTLVATDWDIDKRVKLKSVASETVRIPLS